MLPPVPPHENVPADGGEGGGERVPELPPSKKERLVARQHLSCMGSMYSENAIAAVPPKYAAQNAAETPRRLLLECTLA